MFALPATVCEIIQFNLSKWARIESMTVKSRSMSWATTSPNILLDDCLNFPMYSIPIFIFKMRVKDVDDLNEAGEGSQRAYVRKYLRF